VEPAPAGPAYDPEERVTTEGDIDKGPSTKKATHGTPKPRPAARAARSVAMTAAVESDGTLQTRENLEKDAIVPDNASTSEQAPVDATSGITGGTVIVAPPPSATTPETVTTASAATGDSGSAGPAVGIAAAAIAAVGLGWFLVAARRRRDEEEEQHSVV